MKKIVQIKTKNTSYKAIIDKNFLNEYLKNTIDLNSKIYIIVDTEVLSKISRKIIYNKKIILIKIKTSEKIKSIEFYWKILSRLLQKKINRSSTLIAIGGGTIGDLGGFIASTVLRGIKFILCPTTLLSQADSSIGGKNGINSKYGKNLIGTFYQPYVVLIDLSFLNSLPLKQIKSGYAEIIKHALIYDKNFYNWLKKNFKKLFLLRKNELMYAISKSLKIKSIYITNDEKEKLGNSSSRSMLNYGHSFGHAIETLNNYKSNLTHGEAISIGMVVAARISFNLKKIKLREFNDIKDHLKEVGLPTELKKYNKEKLFKILSNDKKNINNQINLILLNKIGKAYYKKKIALEEIKKLIN